MAAIFLAKRVAINNISKASTKHVSLYIHHSASTLSRLCFSSFNKGVNVSGKSSDETTRRGLNEAKQEALDAEEALDANEREASAARVVHAKGKQSDTAMNDEAWKASRNQRIRDVTEGGLNDDDSLVDDIEIDETVDEIQDHKDPVDTVEYRSIEEQKNN